MPTTTVVIEQHLLMEWPWRGQYWLNKVNIGFGLAKILAKYWHCNFFHFLPSFSCFLSCANIFFHSLSFQMVYYHVYAYFMLFFYRFLVHISAICPFGPTTHLSAYQARMLTAGMELTSILYIHALAVRTGRACAIVNHFCFNVDEIASTISWNILRSYGEKVITHELMAEII